MLVGLLKLNSIESQTKDFAMPSKWTDQEEGKNKENAIPFLEGMHSSLSHSAGPISFLTASLSFFLVWPSHFQSHFHSQSWSLSQSRSCSRSHSHSPSQSHSSYHRNLITFFTALLCSSTFASLLF